MSLDKKKVYITQEDFARLSRIIALFRNRNRSTRDEWQDRLIGLYDELGEAVIVPPERIPNDVITINSSFTLRYRDNGEEKTCTLVFPGVARYEYNRISVLSQFGISLLGRTAGDTVYAETPEGGREVEIIEILYQPEAERTYA
jgi:regulator of nucleoside diphosphate kinase